MSDADYVAFFLDSKTSIVQLELIEISHPNFSKVYRIVRNNPLGVRVKHENGIYYNYEYYPLAITADRDADDLDQGFKVSVGDLGEVIPNELDRVRLAENFSVKPTFKYRCYRSDDLDNILLGPTVLEVKTFANNRDGASFNAIAPQLNQSATGELYTLDRFDALRGTL